MFIMWDVALDSLMDVLKILPYLFATFLLLEFLEHKVSGKAKRFFDKNHKLGPVFGGLLGALPQCGFSAMAAEFYAGRIISIGTLAAIFLSTSDEMLAVMLGENAPLGTVGLIVGAKLLIGVVVGLLVDYFLPKKKSAADKHGIEHICTESHCHCREKGIFASSLVHCLKTAGLILAFNIIFGSLFYFVGEESVKAFFGNAGIFTVFVAGLIGLIPNCASSVILTEAFLAGLIPVGALMAGLLPASGLGILLLFRHNKNQRENFLVLGIIYGVGILVGLLANLFFAS